jgi:hypothetical protein
MLKQTKYSKYYYDLYEEGNEDDGFVAYIGIWPKDKGLINILKDEYGNDTETECDFTEKQRIELEPIISTFKNISGDQEYRDEGYFCHEYETKGEVKKMLNDLGFCYCPSGTKIYKGKNNDS